MKGEIVKKSIVAIGLPRTGKTTFLAAFWDVVGSGDVQDSLQLEKTDGDMHYLNQIRIDWGNCDNITRTGPASDNPVTMHLRDCKSSVTAELSWTDMLGESFERQWTDRVWTRAYQQLINESAGAVFFVHPSMINHAELISEHRPAPHDGIGKTDALRGEIKNPWIATGAPTQVQLVELLQFIQDYRKSSDKFRLAIVVSAWDLVGRKVSPDVWVETTVPLFHQFLTANEESFAYQIFGVSAQGGDYSDGADILRSAHYRNADRIRVVHGSTSSSDITVPVRFAIGLTGD